MIYAVNTTRWRYTFANFSPRRVIIIFEFTIFVFAQKHVIPLCPLNGPEIKINFVRFLDEKELNEAFTAQRSGTPKWK